MINCILSNTHVLWSHMSKLWVAVSGTLFYNHICMSLTLPIQLQKTERCKPSSANKTIADKSPHLENKLSSLLLLLFVYMCTMYGSSQVRWQTCVCMCLESQDPLDVFFGCFPPSVLGRCLTLNLELIIAASLASQLGLCLSGTEVIGGSPHPFSFYMGSGIWIPVLLLS